MREKTGFTGKLTFDFPTEAVLEVCINGNWYRTTSKEFRSFDGKRRYLKPLQQPSQGGNFTDVPVVEVNYDGPVYLHGTNTKVEKKNTERICNSFSREEYLQTSKSRNTDG